MTKQKLHAALRSLVGGSLILLGWNALSALYNEEQSLASLSPEPQPVSPEPTGISVEPTPTPGSNPIPTPSPTPTPKPSGTYRDGTYAASSETPWGTLTVQVTAKGGTWTSVNPTVVPNDAPSHFAAPRLVQQALKAQSANVDGISGATYTSDAFRDNLKSIVQQSKV